MIKYLIILIIVISSIYHGSSSNTLFAQEAFDAKINYEFINGNVLIIRAGDVYPDQIVAVKSEKGIVIFDTGISPTLTHQYREIIEREFDSDNFIYVVNTHHHFDHTNGNQVFKDAVIIAHENCTQAMIDASSGFEGFIEYRRARYQRRDKLAETLNPEAPLRKRLKDLVFMSSHMCDDLETNFELALPRLTFSDQLSIDLGNMTLELFHFPPGFHTNNDLFAIIPELGLLFTGDIIQEDFSLSWINSTHDLKGAIEVISDLMNSCNEIKEIITIHAGIVDGAALKKIRNSFNNLLIQKASKKSAVELLEKEIKTNGIESAIRSFKMINNDDVYIWEGDLINLADKLFSQEKKDEGLKLFQLASQLFPNSANACEWLGDAYYQVGNYNKAKESFARALKIYPLGSFAADMIFQIENRTTE